MPIHLNYQGTICSKCAAEFIAHKAGCLCPLCQTAAAEVFDFVPATIASMKDHKQMYGNYFPESWFSGSVADLVQGVIFELFDNFEAERPEDAYGFIIGQLSDIGWEEGQTHLAGQTEEIALQIYEIYRQDPDFRGDALKEKPLNPKLKNILTPLDKERGI